MDDLAAEAGITKPILYRHFGDKGGLYRALAERYLLTLVTGRRAIVKEIIDPEERIRATIEGYLVLVERDPDVYRFLAHHALRGRPEANTPLSEYMRALATDIADEVREGLGTIDGDSTAAEPWAYGIIGFIQTATDWWLEDRPLPRERFIDHLVSLLWAGLSQGKVRVS
jgi:AcrR family transcriptional regulator